MIAGPFASSAIELAEYGLAVLPLAGEDGKVPQIRWKAWKNPPGSAFIEKLIQAHGAANIGVVCHLSKVTVVDIDDADLLDSMLHRFGGTPLMTATPSGGYHLWYRHTGETSGNLATEGLSVDIKAKGGVIVTPPSIRPSGPQTGKTYGFHLGSWADLARLPTLKAGSLPSTARAASIPNGYRNDHLFRSLLKEAHACDTPEQLRDSAAGIILSFDEPIEEWAVAATIASVWKYKIEGRLFVQGRQILMLTIEQFDVLKKNSDALLLFHLIQAAHGASERPFAISPVSMTSADLLPGWTSRRYAAARKWLVEAGVIMVVHAGGRGPGDAWQFEFGDPTKGAIPASNITRHPSPLSYSPARGVGGAA